LPRVKTEVRKYIKGKDGRGGFSLEGLTSFLDLAHGDPITWGVANAADELLTVLWRSAWRAVHDEQGAAARAAARIAMLDDLTGYIDVLSGGEQRQARELLGRMREAADSDFAWHLRPEADKTALSDLCAHADIEETGVELEDDDGQLMLFTFAGGKKIDGIVAFPDASVPGKSRSVYARFCTIRQYELHVGMKRVNANRADSAASGEEEKLAWLIDRASGDRTKLIFDLRDDAPPPPPADPRPAA
jgi:hypothetical protein